VPHRTTAEYYQDHKEEIKQYQQDHQEEIKQYQQDHKVEIKKYKQQYYQDHREKLRKKHDCPCGGRYTHEHKARHLKSEHHHNYILGKQIYMSKFGHA
jgi:hypothetical protein